MATKSVRIRPNVVPALDRLPEKSFNSLVNALLEIFLQDAAVQERVRRHSPYFVHYNFLSLKNPPAPRRQPKIVPKAAVAAPASPPPPRESKPGPPMPPQAPKTAPVEKPVETVEKPAAPKSPSLLDSILPK